MVSPSRGCVRAAVGRPPTDLHFCGRAGQRQSLPAQEGAAGRWPPRLRAGELTARRLAFRDATEESLRVHRTSSAGRLRAAGPLFSGVRPRGSLLAVAVRRFSARLEGGRSHLALKSLVPEWPHPTRLETRTKECNVRASPGVANPSAQ